MNFESLLIGGKIQMLQSAVSYYKNGYFPELKETTGVGRAEHLKRAVESLERFKVDVNDWRQHKRFDLLSFNRSDIYLILRSEACNRYYNDHDSENLFVRMRCLRFCVAAFQRVKECYPEFDIYSNRAFVNGNIQFRLDVAKNVHNQ